MQQWKKSALPIAPGEFGRMKIWSGCLCGKGYVASGIGAGIVADDDFDISVVYSGECT